MGLKPPKDTGNWVLLMFLFTIPPAIPCPKSLRFPAHHRAMQLFDQGLKKDLNKNDGHDGKVGENIFYARICQIMPAMNGHKHEN
jgi:hypothetical protein